jgi:hypothetical protein
MVRIWKNKEKCGIGVILLLTMSFKIMPEEVTIETYNGMQALYAGGELEAIRRSSGLRIRIQRAGGFIIKNESGFVIIDPPVPDENIPELQRSIAEFANNGGVEVIGREAEGDVYVQPPLPNNVILFPGGSRREA